MIRNKFETLFNNIDLMGVRECFQPVKKEYAKGENITISLPENNNIGIITGGTVYLVTINCDGQRRILEYYTNGDIIEQELLPGFENKVFYFFAKSACTIEFIKYNKLITPCKNNCSKHIALIDEFMRKQDEKQIIHLDILMQKSVRDKLVTFFEYLSAKKGTAKFTVPLPFTDLADYLSVDRSAMMRELTKMNNDNIIISNKRKITLLKELKE